VLALVVMFTVTGVAAIWLARDVNERVSDRSALQSIAFQAARAGAQQIDIGSIRESSDGVEIDPAAARVAAASVASRLAEQYGLDAQIVEQGFESSNRRDSWFVLMALPDGDELVTADDVAENRVIHVTGIAHAEAGN
jgi:hypothetical protein